MYRPFVARTPLTSVYFGGGTSNLYRADQYARLLQLVRNLFPDLGGDTEVTLEGIPQLFTREKLDAIFAGVFHVRRIVFAISSGCHGLGTH